MDPSRCVVLASPLRGRAGARTENENRKHVHLFMKATTRIDETIGEILRLFIGQLERRLFLVILEIS